MAPSEDSTSSRATEPLADPAKLLPQLLLTGGHGALGRAQLQRQRDQALLDPIVEVALDPPPGLVGGGHDAPTGSVQLGSRLRVGDGGGDQLGELGKARLGVRRQRLRPGRQHGDQPPQAPVDHDRTANARPDATLVEEGRDRALGVPIALDPRRPPRPRHQRRQVAPFERELPAHRHVTAALAPARHHRHRAVPLIAGDIRDPGIQQAASLLGHGREHLARRDATGHQRRHPPQGRLLVGEPAERPLRRDAGGVPPAGGHGHPGGHRH
jgi:hypothetical protein